MNLITRVFVLKKIPPFQELLDSELCLIARIARSRRYPPGGVIAGAGTPLSRLYIVAEGYLQLADGTVLPRILGLASLLFEQTAPLDVMAAPGRETVCLTINKDHFFTLIHECPAFVLGLLQQVYPEKVLL
ncbi:MAG: cyclic nucleotide-binding domain-containing protein [bacterium]